MAVLSEAKSLIGQGRTAEVFDIGNDKILKLFRNSIPKEFAKNEYKVSLDISKELDCIPKVYEFLEVDNRSGIIYEKISGVTMMKLISIKPWSVKKEGKRLANLHKEMQIEVNFELENTNKRLKDNIIKTEMLTADIKAVLFEYIDKLPVGNILCHGDFHPDNILITKNKEIVIDWMTATKGNKLADIARTSVMLKFGVVPNRSFVETKIINFARTKLYEAYLNHYIKISGATHEEIRKWELPVAAARLIEYLPKSEKEELVNFINTEIRKYSGEALGGY